MNTDGQPFRWEGPALADRLGDVRRAIQDWAERANLPADLIDELALASYEAMANAAEHAYVDVPPGPLSVLVRATVAGLDVVVADQGKWRVPDNGDGFRGRGIVVIRGLATDVAVTATEQGTTVRMRWQLG
jgi:anti-sigma regulatory factor (Ser/Thr protein kinase)